MKLGTSLRFVFPASNDTLRMYQQLAASLPPGAFIERPMGPIDVPDQASHLVEVTQAANAAGMWAVLVGDNHAVPPAFANCFQPIPTIARLSAVSGPLHIGAVLLAPFYHPLLVAEQIATIAAFVNGPTIWVFAVGDSPRAFAAFAMPKNERAKRTSALISAVRGLLEGETVTAEGPGWQLDQATISLPRHRPQLLVAGAAPGAVARAARLGDGWLTAQNATDDELVQQLSAYRAGCETANRPPLPVLRRDIFVAPTDQQALDHVEPILAEGYRGVGLERLLVGSPATIVKRLASYRDLGFHHVLVRHISGDHGAILESFDLIGRHVVPEVGEWTSED